MKKIPLGITIGLMAITSTVTFVITSNVTLDMFNEKIKSVSEKQELYSKLSEIDTYSRTHFIGSIDESKLIDGMVRGFINGIGDEYAEYLTAEEYAKRQAEQTGVSVWLGFYCEKEPGGYIRITEVAPGTSAEEEGLLPGDIITAVNNVDVIAFAGGYDEAVSHFKCEEGARVKLYVKRTGEDGANDFINYEVAAGRSEQMTVTGRLIGDTGYVRITQITDKTEAQLKTKLDELISGGAAGLVFDLRGNKGGSLEALGKCLDHIIGDGEIVFAEYKNKNTETVVSCRESEEIKMPMSVIVNHNTSGAAELFAFALRDCCNAHTVGKSTAGKGYMQTVYTCSDGSVVLLSSAVLKTADSGDFNKTGLKPEFDVTLSSEIDLNTVSDEAALLTDSQLIKALEVTVPKE